MMMSRGPSAWRPWPFGMRSFIRQVKNGEGVEQTMHLSVDCKGILGSDNRKYILDLVRTTARDPSYSEPQHAMCVLRPELLHRFVEHKRKQWLSANPTADPAAMPSFALNPDALTSFELGGSAVERDADLQLLKEAGEFLLGVVIPQLIRDFRSLDISPVDGTSLAEAMHVHGINMRYLGRIAKLSAGSLEHVEAISVREMIARAAKHLFNEVRHAHCSTCTPECVPARTRGLAAARRRRNERAG